MPQREGEARQLNLFLLVELARLTEEMADLRDCLVKMDNRLLAQEAKTKI